MEKDLKWSDRVWGSICAEVRDISVQMTDATSHSRDLEQIIFPLGASGAIEQCKSSVTSVEEEGGKAGSPLLHGCEGQTPDKPRACRGWTGRSLGS